MQQHGITTEFGCQTGEQPIRDKLLAEQDKVRDEMRSVQEDTRVQATKTVRKDQRKTTPKGKGKSQSAVSFFFFFSFFLFCFGQTENMIR
jgi:hypothetical protein